MFSKCYFLSLTPLVIRRINTPVLDIYSEPNENGLLCSMMRSPEVLADCSNLPEEIFFLPANRILFQALRSLHASGQPVDFVLLASYLEKRPHGRKSNELVEVGGLQGLQRIHDFVPCADNWKWYRRHVLEYHRGRKYMDQEKEQLLKQIKHQNDHIRWLESLLPTDSMRVESWTRRSCNTKRRGVTT